MLGKEKSTPASAVKSQAATPTKINLSQHPQGHNSGQIKAINFEYLDAQPEATMFVKITRCGPAKNIQITCSLTDTFLCVFELKNL